MADDDPAADERFMRAAIEQAAANRRAPFGAVLVDGRSGGVVAAGVNRSRENPTLHGEIVAINAYADSGGDAWPRLTLYTTAEPCCMCQGAILWSGIGRVVFGTSIDTLTRLGWKQIVIPADEVTRRSWRSGELPLTGGVLEAECDELFRAAIAMH